MKQTIEIEVPDGKKAVWKDNKMMIIVNNRLSGFIYSSSLFTYYL